MCQIFRASWRSIVTFCSHVGWLLQRRVTPWRKKVSLKRNLLILDTKNLKPNFPHRPLPVDQPSVLAGFCQHWLVFSSVLTVTLLQLPDDCVSVCVCISTGEIKEVLFLQKLSLHVAAASQAKPFVFGQVSFPFPFFLFLLKKKTLLSNMLWVLGEYGEKAVSMAT